mmetsp:Transcript_25578/g.67610  ORF Transcript_25578/g.67610 Transcript_25578/m.67610 type:complete len:222 (+) Transcript_25578:613-1278(+)
MRVLSPDAVTSMLLPTPGRKFESEGDFTSSFCIHATPVTACVWPLRVAITWPVIEFHTTEVLSSDAEASLVPSRFHAALSTQSLCSSNCIDFAPVAASQMKTSFFEVEASLVQSGLQTTLRTKFEWPSNVMISSPVSAFQIFAVMSSDAEAILVLSGLQSTLLTPAKWPLMVIICSPVRVLHILTVLSHDEEATLLPSGHKATHVTAFECPSRAKFSSQKF